MSLESNSRGRGGFALTALAVLALLVGVVLVGFGLGTQRPDPPSPTEAAAGPSPTADDDTSDDSDAGSGDGASEDTSGSTAEAEASPTATESATAEPSESEAEPTVQALDPSEPVEVRIPSISVTSPLHALGLTDDGTLEVPSGDRYHEAAWYDGSPTPGEAGPTVIEGHVTGAGGVESIFFDLGALEPGDTAEVDREDGRTVIFEVYRVDQFAKDEFPTVDVYGPTSEPELRLITCGGEFDEAAGSHEDNTVVYARMVEG
ncbi:class F sortase [Serinicoccus kebangsaanensis]|uniref:class F sortase n=1 Tax=Serinicoccus kebangsaanensis TaxID=2602069 RepID=UPI00124CE90E|nr:class F sortase [Serinicoccus kebangsaanensis]